jgi:solute carrier family 6 amino acid transporter-like protein 5/7/9/14
MAYAMFYLFAGFTSKLPWGTCKHDFNSDRCFSLVDAAECEEGIETFYMRDCVNATFFCSQFGHYFDESKNGTCQRINVPINSTDMEIPFAEVTYRVSASEDYWYKRVLNFEVENGIVNTTVNSWSQWGGIRWELVGCLALAWALICLSLIQGVQSYGKVV